MLDGKKLRVVARFELLEALRSRLFIIVISMYGAGAAIGSYAFIQGVKAAEQAARQSLAKAMLVDESKLPPDLVREQALRAFSSMFEDEQLREGLMSMPLLSIFYGFMAMNLVGLLVLVVSTGTMAADLSSGAARYALFRCDRVTWATGKLLGQEALLAAGLTVGALVTGIMGFSMDPAFDHETWLWLLRTSFRAWLYGSAFMGLFAGISLIAGSPLKARALALFFWIGLIIAHSIVTADFLNERIPYLHYLGYAFPGAHWLGLWSPSYNQYLTSAGALLVIGGVGFALGQRLFHTRDA